MFSSKHGFQSTNVSDEVLAFTLSMEFQGISLITGTENPQAYLITESIVSWRISVSCVEHTGILASVACSLMTQLPPYPS